jgi:hypothetical protein
MGVVHALTPFGCVSNHGNHFSGRMPGWMEVTVRGRRMFVASQECDAGQVG